MPLSCPTKPSIMNAATTDTNTMFNAVMKFTCNEGFYGANQTLDSTFVCSYLNGSKAVVPYGWVAQGTDIRPGGCDPVQCSVPRVSNFVHNTSTTVIYGDVIEGRCSVGYELISGDVVRSCVVDGSNSSVGMLNGSSPVCKPIECSDPGVPVDGKRNSSARTYTDVIEYECNNGFVLNGTSTIQCQADGTWTAPTPHCTGKIS